MTAGVLIASGVSLDNARSAIRISVGRETTPDEIKQAVGMITAAIAPEYKCNQP